MSLQSSASAPAPSAPVDALPALSTYTASTEDDRIDGLELVADSVAQQRQVTSKMLIFHPVNLAVYFVAIGILISYLQRVGHDWIMMGTLIGGLTMCSFAAVRWAAGGYIALAEEINWEWLGEDRLVVVKWGEEIIGALVLGWADSELKKKGGRRKRGKAVIRAWTVKLKYRGKGIGEGLLEEAVKVAGEKGADGIVFDADHASKFALSVMMGLRVVC
jgi:GNAT superfamily N-acetyltransferase